MRYPLLKKTCPVWNSTLSLTHFAEEISGGPWHVTALLSLAGMLQNMLKPGDMLMLSCFFVLAWAAAVLLPKVLDMTRYLPEKSIDTPAFFLHSTSKKHSWRLQESPTISNLWINDVIISISILYIHIYISISSTIHLGFSDLKLPSCACRFQSRKRKGACVKQCKAANVEVLSLDCSRFLPPSSVRLASFGGPSERLTEAAILSQETVGVT